jgi:hypothetical protein
MQKECAAIREQRKKKRLVTLHFSPKWLVGDAKFVYSMRLNNKQPFYNFVCRVAASPQATIEIPLSSINELVTIIHKSEGLNTPGATLSGPEYFDAKTKKRWRQGVRSQALYDAQDMVNKSRNHHIGKQTQLPNGKPVTAANFSRTLQGLLILIVSYLRTSELRYADDLDTEPFAKAYIPLNVKNPFRLLFTDLSADEKEVFNGLYDSPRVKLFALAKKGSAASVQDGDKPLFPARVLANQREWFVNVPTWNDFVEKTVTNKKLLCAGPFCGATKKKCHLKDCEVLFAPLTSIIPHKKGSRRVTIEMRRLGWQWVWSTRWKEMTKMIFRISKSLNK